MSQHPSPSLEENEEETEEKQVVDIEKQAREEAEKTLHEQVPELAVFNYLIQVAVGFGVLPYISKRAGVAQSFNTLNDPHFEHNLLKVKDPQKFKEIQKARIVAGREIEKQKENLAKREVERDYAQVGVGPFKRRLNFKSFERKEEGFKVADAIQKRIAGVETRNKINNTAAIFGLDEERVKLLKSSMSEWLRRNKGRTIDDYLVIEGRRLYLSQTGLTEKEVKKDKEKKVELKEKQKTLVEQNQEVRMEAVKENREGVMRGQELIKKTSDPNQPLQTVTREQILEVLHGPSVPLTPTEQKLAKGFAEVPSEFAEEIMGRDITTPSPAKPITSQPQITPTPILAPSPPPLVPSIPTTRARLPLVSQVLNIKDEIKNKVFSYIAESAFGQVVKKGVSSAVTKIASTIFGTAIKTGFSAVIKGAIGVGTGGATLVWEGIKIVGKKIAEKIPVIGGAINTALDLPDKVITYGVAAIIILAVGLPFLFLILGTSLSSTLFPIGSENAMKIDLSSDSKLHAWNEFEKEFLMTERPVLSGYNWRQFEKENLIPEQKQLSLDQ